MSIVATSSSPSCTLLIHGHTSSSLTWREVLPELSRYGPCYAINLRGHGGLDIGNESEYDLAHLSQDVWHFCDEKKIERVAIIAHSMGCRIAVTMAAQNPERVANLLLMDMEMEPRDPEVVDEESLEHIRTFRAQHASFDEMKESLMAYGYTEALITKMLHDNKIVRDSMGGYLVISHPYTDYLARNLLSTSPDVKNSFIRLPALMPITLLLAEQDSSVSVEGKEWMESHHPGLQVQTISGSDHRIHKTAKEAFLKIATRFVSEANS